MIERSFRTELGNDDDVFILLSLNTVVNIDDLIVLLIKNVEFAQAFDLFFDDILDLLTVIFNQFCGIHDLDGDLFTID